MKELKTVDHVIFFGWPVTLEFESMTQLQIKLEF